MVEGRRGQQASEAFFWEGRRRLGKRCAGQPAGGQARRGRNAREKGLPALTTHVGLVPQSRSFLQARPVLSLRASWSGGWDGCARCDAGARAFAS